MTARSTMTTEPSVGGRGADYVALRVAWATLVMALMAAPSVRAGGPEVVVVKAASLHVGDGRVISSGMIVIRDGRVAAVGSALVVPPEAEVIEVATGSITPGLIDANALLEPADLLPTPRPDPRAMASAAPAIPLEEIFGRAAQRRAHVEEEGDEIHPDHGPPAEPLITGRRGGLSLAEHASEVVPHTRVIDSVDLRSPDLARLLRGGVTTVYASPDSAAVIGSQGAIVRTGGPVADRVVRTTHGVKAVMGSDSYRVGRYNRAPWGRYVSIYTRRPNTRMGVSWVFRKAFYDADRYARSVPRHGADTPSDEALAVLQQVRAGEIPLRIQARLQHDILTALRVSDEFDLPFILEEATDAYKCIDQIKARSVPVILGPIEDRASRETRRFRLATFRALREAGIVTALSALDRRDEDGLARQAMVAMRTGADLGEALRAVTQTPARLLGLDKEIGTLEAGKRADVVVWSGRPFAADAKPVLVLIGGEVVWDQPQRHINLPVA